MKQSRYLFIWKGPGHRFRGGKTGLLAGYAAIALLLFLSLFHAAVSAALENDPLTPEEREWLRRHDGTITIANLPDDPPYTFIDAGGNPSGISVEHARLMEKKLNFKFRYSKLDIWVNMLKKLQDKEIDVIGDIGWSEDRARNILYTPAYVETPYVIVVNRATRGRVTLEEMNGMRVSVVEGYLCEGYLKNNFKQVKVVPEISNRACLRSVASGESDAALLNLALAVYAVEHGKFTTLRFGGYTDFTYRAHFGSRNDLPVLNRILTKGLALITPEERDDVYRKWASLEMPPFYKKNNFRITLFCIMAALLSIFFWNRALKRQVAERSDSLGRQALALKREIAARKRTERDLREKERRLRALLQAIPDPLWIKGPNGVYISCNREFERYTGIDENTLRGKTVHDLFGERAEAFSRYDNSAVTSGAPFIVEETFFHVGEGVQKQMEIIKSPMYDENGKFAGILGVARDFTGDKEAERALIRDRELYESILANIRGVTYRCKPVGEWPMEYISPHVTRVTGYPPEVFTGEASEIPPGDSKIPFRSIIVDRDRQGYLDAIRDAVVSGRPWDREYRLRRGNGEVRWIREKGAAVYNREGDLEYLDGFFIDITERKMMEESLNQAQKMESIGLLAGGIAHDFNNILGSMLGFSELIRRELIRASHPERMGRWMERIIKGGIRARELVTQILAYSRSEERSAEPLDLTAVVKEVSRLLSATLPEGIEIKHRLIAAQKVTTDITRIHQILMNLAVNASHAMEERGGVLSIELTDHQLDKAAIGNREGVFPGAFVRLGVGDTGPGMDEEMQKRITEPFFTTKSRGRGSGMGLWVVREIVENMGGFMAVSCKKGEGSRFDVYMPAMDAPSPARAPREVPDTPLPEGTGRILFVDDEMSLTQLAGEFLTTLGYEVSLFNSAPAAAAHLAASPPPYDLLITDLTMPEMTGDLLCKAARAAMPEIRVVLTTGFLEECGRETIDLFDAVLKKPVLSHHMATTIRRVLTKSDKDKSHGGHSDHR